MPRKSVTIIFICFAWILTIALFAVRLTAVQAESYFQTWPSRTPTPGPGQTRPPGGSTPGGSGPSTATAESTVPAQTPAANLTSPAGSTPLPTVAQPSAAGTIDPVTPESETIGPGDDGLVTGSPEQAAGCEIPPFIEALGLVSARTGAGIDNEIIGYLQYGDTRAIIGRAALDPWWLIRFDSENEGWVSDQAVLIHGYTGYVSVIGAGNSTPTTATSWDPTPNPACTPPAPETVAALLERLTTGANTGDSEESDFTTNEQQNPSEQGTQSPNAPADTQDGPKFDNQQGTPSSSNSTFTWLLITGVFLIVVGAISLFIRKRNY